MTTNDYCDKYKYYTPAFNVEGFLFDLTIDFETLLEVGNGNTNYKGFQNAVRALKMKYDACAKRMSIPAQVWEKYAFGFLENRERAEFPKEYAHRMEEQRIEQEEEQRRNEYRRRQEEREKSWKQDQEHINSFAAYLQMLYAMFGNSAYTRVTIANLDIPVSSFNILELPYTADKTDVKSAYRKLSLIHHPDRGGSKEAFIKITEAKNRCLAYITSHATSN